MATREQVQEEPNSALVGVGVNGHFKGRRRGLRGRRTSEQSQDTGITKGQSVQEQLCKVCNCWRQVLLTPWLENTGQLWVFSGRHFRKGLRPSLKVALSFYNCSICSTLQTKEEVWWRVPRGAWWEFGQAIFLRVGAKDTGNLRSWRKSKTNLSSRVSRLDYSLAKALTPIQGLLSSRPLDLRDNKPA